MEASYSGYLLCQDTSLVDTIKGPAFMNPLKLCPCPAIKGAVSSRMPVSNTKQGQFASKRPLRSWFGHRISSPRFTRYRTAIL